MQSNTCKGSTQAKRCVCSCLPASVCLCPLSSQSNTVLFCSGGRFKDTSTANITIYAFAMLFFFFSILAGKSSCLFVRRRDQRGQVDAVRADVPLASSLPGLVSTVTFHLKEGIYSVQSVCHRVLMCVSVQVHKQSRVCVCAGAFTGYSNSSCSHWPRNKISLFLQC